MLALIVAARFGMLLGLALWLGLGLALLLVLPVIERQLPPTQARGLSGRLVARLDRGLLAAAVLVLVGLGARVLIDRAAPPTSIVAPVAVMILCRLISAFLVFRESKAEPRHGPDVASSGPSEGLAGSSARGLVLTLEVCLALYALYSVS